MPVPAAIAIAAAFRVAGSATATLVAAIAMDLVMALVVIVVIVVVAIIVSAVGTTITAAVGTIVAGHLNAGHEARRHCNAGENGKADRLHDSNYPERPAGIKRKWAT